jgi:hypothetical protein
MFCALPFFSSAGVLTSFPRSSYAGQMQPPGRGRQETRSCKKSAPISQARMHKTTSQTSNPLLPQSTRYIHPIHPPDTHTKAPRTHLLPPNHYPEKQQHRLWVSHVAGKPNIHWTFTRRDLVVAVAMASATLATPQRAGVHVGFLAPYTVGSPVGSTAQAVRRQTVPKPFPRIPENPN